MTEEKTIYAVVDQQAIFVERFLEGQEQIQPDCYSGMVGH